MVRYRLDWLAQPDWPGVSAFGVETNATETLVLACGTLAGPARPIQMPSVWREPDILAFCCAEPVAQLLDAADFCPSHTAMLAICCVMYVTVVHHPDEFPGRAQDSAAA